MGMAIQIVPQRSPYPAVQPRRATLLRRRVDRKLGWLSAPLGMGSLAAITPAQAANSIFPQSAIRNSAGHNQAIWQTINDSAAAGQMLDNGVPGYVPGSNQCAAVTSGPSGAVVGTQIAASVAAKVAPLTGPAAPFVLLGASIVGLFSSIFGAHAAAVKNEQTLLCAAVPAANQALQTIQAAVSSGQINPAAGIQALQSLQAQFNAAVQKIRNGNDPTSSGQCNAACVMASELAAIIAMMTSQFQDLQAQQAAAATSAPAGPSAAAGVTGAVSSTAASLGIPSWALYAAAGVALFLVLGK